MELPTYNVLMPTDWISTDEASAISHLTVDYLRTLLRQGRLKGELWGRSWKVSRKSLDQYLTQQARQGQRRGRKRKNT
jgi:excisionase family DNA binding protein